VETGAVAIGKCVFVVLAEGRNHLVDERNLGSQYLVGVGLILVGEVTHFIGVVRVDVHLGLTLLENDNVAICDKFALVAVAFVGMQMNIRFAVKIQVLFVDVDAILKRQQSDRSLSRRLIRILAGTTSQAIDGLVSEIHTLRTPGDQIVGLRLAVIVDDQDFHRMQAQTHVTVKSQTLQFVSDFTGSHAGEVLEVDFVGDHSCFQNFAPDQLILLGQPTEPSNVFVHTVSRSIVKIATLVSER